MKIRTVSRAQQELAEIIVWWAENRPNAASLAEAVKGTYLLLTSRPFAGTPFPTKRTPELRRVLISLSSHWIYYRVTHDAVLVLAVWSSKRGVPSDL